MQEGLDWKMSECFFFIETHKLKIVDVVNFNSIPDKFQYLF